MIDQIGIDFVDIIIPPKDHLKLIRIAANKMLKLFVKNLLQIHILRQ